MAVSKQNLLDQISAAITSNGTAAITGPVLNTVLTSMTNSLAGGYSTFPKDVSLSTSDIGKLVMNDGSGTAKVYQFSSGTEVQLGEFTITLNSLGDLSDGSTINIHSNSYNTSFTRIAWRNGTTPTTVNQELNLIKTYIASISDLHFLSVSVSTNVLTIEENTYSGTSVDLYQFPNDALALVTISLPALPAAPTAFPLGKLLGIDGDNALISNAQTETYLLNGTLTLENALYDSTTSIDISDIDALLARLQPLIIVPAADGKAQSFNYLDIVTNGNAVQILSSIRQQVLGLAITTDGNTVTVINLNMLSLIMHFVRRIYIASK